MAERFGYHGGGIRGLRELITEYPEAIEYDLSDSELIGYDVTVECFADPGGVKAMKYLNDGMKSAP